LPEAVSGYSLLGRALEETKVAFVPGGAFFHDGSGANTIRLSYSLPKPAMIEAGISQIATLLR
jgi:DNA-binding transcriptional MocR family regulator